MNLFLKACRRLHPKHYIRSQMTRIERELHGLKLWTGTDMQKGEQRDRAKKLQDDRYEFHLWQTEIEDKTLIKKAVKIGVYLDEIVFPDTEDHNNVGRYHRIEDFGSEIFRNEFRGPLVKAIREREPAYRKEQRDQVEIYIKLFVALTGMMGTATGLFAIIFK